MRRTKPPANTNASVPLPGLTMSAGVQYANPASVQAMADGGIHDGRQGLFDPAWGVNAVPEAATTQDQSGQVAAHLAAIAYGQSRRDLETQAWAVHARFAQDLAGASAALMRRQLAARDLQDLRAQAKAADLGEPAPDTGRRRTLLILGNVVLAVGLAVPDLLLTAPAFDGLGLSDTPLLGTSTLSDERHIAAFAVVLACVLLAHTLGRTLPSAARTAGLRLTAMKTPSSTAVTASIPETDPHSTTE